MKEGEIVTVALLTNEWKETLSKFDLFIDNGLKLRPIRFIVRHIIKKGYDKVLFPGTSLYSLLVSIPIDNKVNYNKTLQITFDELTEELQFHFSDWTGVNREHIETKSRILWRDTCQATEGSSLLESFFSDNEDFRKVTKDKIAVD